MDLENEGLDLESKSGGYPAIIKHREIVADLKLEWQDVLATSWGLSTKADPHCLAITFDAVDLRRPLQEANWKEIPREKIRSIDVTGESLVFRLGLEDLLFSVDANEAESLRDTLIKMPIMPVPVRSGSAIQARDWRIERIAGYVGLVVIKAAEVEHVLSIITNEVAAPN